MKRLLQIVAALVILIIVGLVAAFLYIDVIAKAAIERGSTIALGVTTTLNTASLKIFQGQLVMTGLNVANPPGYQTKHFLDLKNGDVAVSLGSLRSDIVEVPHLRLKDIDINLEKKDGKANYQTILDNLKGSETKPAEPAKSEGKRFIVKEVSVKNVVVHLDALGLVGAVNIPIDEIELQNVGSDTGKGVLLKDLAGVIVKAIFMAIVDKAGSIIPADITGELKSGLAQLESLEKIADVKKLGELVKPLTDLKEVGDVSNAVKGVGEKATEGIGKAAEGLGGLLGGKKDNP